MLPVPLTELCGDKQFILGAHLRAREAQPVLRSAEGEGLTVTGRPPPGAPSPLYVLHAGHMQSPSYGPTPSPWSSPVTRGVLITGQLTGWPEWLLLVHVHSRMPHGSLQVTPSLLGSIIIIVSERFFYLKRGIKWEHGVAHAGSAAAAPRSPVPRRAGTQAP